MNKFIYIILLMCFYSCKTNNNSVEDQRSRWIDKEIVLHDNFKVRILDKDTTDYLRDTKYKVVIFVDSTGCSECKLQLHKWKDLIGNNKIHSDSLAFLLIINTNNMRKVSVLAKKNDFQYPIFIDQKGESLKVNGIKSNNIPLTFLLNENNKIIEVGNPVFNPDIWDNYKKKMNL